jgi:hypothetical protein
MYQVVVKSVKRGFWGPKIRELLVESGPYPEPILAIVSQYRDDPRYIVTFKDLTGYLGDMDDRVPPANPTAWDFDGEPVEDNREREALRDAERVDPELEQEYAEHMGWVAARNAAGAQGADVPF